MENNNRRPNFANIDLTVSGYEITGSSVFEIKLYLDHHGYTEKELDKLFKSFSKKAQKLAAKKDKQLKELQEIILDTSAPSSAEALAEQLNQWNRLRYSDEVNNEDEVSEPIDWPDYSNTIRELLLNDSLSIWLNGIEDEPEDEAKEQPPKLVDLGNGAWYSPPEVHKWSKPLTKKEKKKAEKAKKKAWDCE